MWYNNSWEIPTARLSGRELGALCSMLSRYEWRYCISQTKLMYLLILHFVYRHIQSLFIAGIYRHCFIQVSFLQLYTIKTSYISIFRGHVGNQTSFCSCLTPSSDFLSSCLHPTMVVGLVTLWQRRRITGLWLIKGTGKSKYIYIFTKLTLVH